MMKLCDYATLVNWACHNFINCPETQANVLYRSMLVVQTRCADEAIWAL